MNDARIRSWLLGSILLPALIAAGCGQSGTTSYDAAIEDDADAAEVEAVEEEAETAEDFAAPVEAAAPIPAAAKQAAPKQAPAAVNAVAPPEPVAPPAPRMIALLLPAGTQLDVELVDALSSGTNQVGDPVRARLAADLTVDGRLVARSGAELYGSVTEVVPLKKLGGQPSIAVTFNELTADSGESVAIVAWLNQVGKKQAGRDAAKIGGGAAAGAILGHQMDDDKGSKIGAVIGGAIGTAVAAKTGKEVELAAGTRMLVVLEGDATARVAG